MTLASTHVTSEYSGGCLLEFLDRRTQVSIIHICGGCAMAAFRDEDGITNILGGDCTDGSYHISEALEGCTFHSQEEL
jgi:hypothetical protein